MPNQLAINRVEVLEILYMYCKIVGIFISQIEVFLQVSKLQNLKANMICGSNPELRRTSSFDKSWEENTVESGANELELQVQSLNNSSKSGPINSVPENQQTANEASKIRSKDSKAIKSARLSHEDKRVGKTHDEKRARARKMMEFHNIKISQVL